MRGNEGFSIVNDVGGDTVATLKGGIYAVDAHAGTWGGGNVHLQVRLGDGSTWQDVGSSTNFTADGFTTQVYLPPGAYRLHVTTATGVYARVIRIPEE